MMRLFTSAQVRRPRYDVRSLAATARTRVLRWTARRRATLTGAEALAACHANVASAWEVCTPRTSLGAVPLMWPHLFGVATRSGTSSSLAHAPGLMAFTDTRYTSGTGSFSLRRFRPVRQSHGIARHPHNSSEEFPDVRRASVF